jgi:hypothetical protein
MNITVFKRVVQMGHKHVKKYSVSLVIKEIKIIQKYYSAIKNEIMSFAEKWIKQEMIMLNKVIQTEKNHILTHVQNQDLTNDRKIK